MTAEPPPAPPPLVSAHASHSSGSTTVTTAASVLSLGVVGYFALKLINCLQSRSHHPHRLVPPPVGGMKPLAGGGFGGSIHGTRTVESASDMATGDGDDDEYGNATTKLHIEVSETERCALKISMASITNLGDLQELVADVCEEAGFTQLDDLVMLYKRPDGEFATVTRSVTIAMLKQSPALRLAPAASAKGKKGSKKSARR